jgi:curved DNA-binding protein CbpA
MPQLRSLYDVLNVAPDAEPVVVDAAYKALIKKYHPDQAAEAPVPKDVAAINEAFAVLKDPARRADYDHRLWKKQQALRLVELQAGGGTDRPPRFVAVSGWLIAGLLACALAAVVMGKGPMAAPLAAGARAAQPEESENPVRAAAAKAAAAEAAHDRTVHPSSAAVIARVRAQHEVLPVRRSEPRAAAVRYRKAKPAARARSEPRRERDFLEEQGYIY